MILQNDMPITQKRSAVRRVLGCVLAIPLTCSAIIALMWVYSFFVTDFGRITDFTSIAIPDEIVIGDTHYTISVTPNDRMVTRNELYLVNNITAERELIFEYVGHFSAAAYTIFVHNDRRYIILRKEGGASDGALSYIVLDITTDEPSEIGRGSACSNPRLSGDSLSFYLVPGNCDYFPFGFPIGRGISGSWHMSLTDEDDL